MSNDFIQSVIDFLVYLLFLGIFGVIFYFGSYVAGFIRRHMKSLYRLIPLNLSRTQVDLVIKGVLALIAVVVSLIFKPSFGEVFTSILPTGDFNSIADSFSDTGDQWLSNVFFGTAFTHILFTFFYFVPYFGINLVINVVENFICRDDEPSTARSLLAFVLEIVTLLSINTIVLCSGNTFLVIMARFIEAAQDRTRLGLWMFLIFVFFLMMYYVLRDLLSSDIILSTFGVILSAAIFSIDLTERNRWILLGVAIFLGMISKLIRGKLIDDEDEDSDRWNGLYGISSLIIVAILVSIGLNLLGKYYPSL